MPFSHIITGLPDAYGRGRIIGDYRRVALYGVDRLIEDKEEEGGNTKQYVRDVIRNREEFSEQIKALKELKGTGEKFTALIFPDLQKMCRKPSSGCTSDIWELSRSRMERPCPWDVPLPSLIFTQSAI